MKIGIVGAGLLGLSALVRSGKRRLLQNDPEISKYDPYHSYPEGVIVGATHGDVVDSVGYNIFLDGKWFDVHPPNPGSLPNGAYGIRYEVRDYDMEKRGLLPNGKTTFSNPW